MENDSASMNTYETAGIRADEAFSLLGSETRLSILLELWENYDPVATNNSDTFSALREAVDATDSGQFNYHLGKLVGPFIHQSEDGYALTQAGLSFVQAVIAGTAMDEHRIESTDVDETCPRCGSQVMVTYEDEKVALVCTDCPGNFRPGSGREGFIFQFVFPPAGITGRTPAGILRAAFSYQLHRIESLMDGVCPTCGGRVKGWLDICDDHDAGDGICDVCNSAFPTLSRWRCTVCKTAMFGPGWEPVMNHPAVVAFYHDHGVDHDHSSWATATRAFAWAEELVSTDPARVRVTVSFDDDELIATIDETLNVLEVKREGHGSSADGT